MKWFLIILIAIIAFVGLASMQMLPDPIQMPVNEAAGHDEPRTKEDIGINEDVHGEAGRS
jgi:hypothetical protein